MEVIIVEDNSVAFDKALKEGLPEGGDIAIYLKRDATDQGKSVAMITFSVKLPDGTIRRAQAVTTARNLVRAGQVIAGLTISENTV